MAEHVESLSVLCNRIIGENPVSVTPLPQAGGDRRYYRLFLQSGNTVVGVVSDSIADTKAFIALSGIFRKHGVSVPVIYGHSRDYSYYLEEDLGDTSLFSDLRNPDIDAICRRVMRDLVKMQTVPAEEWCQSVNYRDFSERQAMWDLNYFKYEFLKPVGVDFDEDLLEDDFVNLSSRLALTDCRLWGFMMRDCQSRNVMLTPEPVFIDYQGGRFGPGLYDAVSFIMQAKAGFSTEFRREMLGEYVNAFAEAKGISTDVVLEPLGEFVLFRTLQVLGAYGFRGLVQKRAHFIESIPGALANLALLVDYGVIDKYPELLNAVRQVLDNPRFETADDGRLHVKVFSFSYKRGYPEDLTGNGGGFMFDCRGMHNPGRYDEYKSLTGRDKPVVDFLKERGEADVFSSRAFDMVSPTVERYLKRGFSSLQIGFGCTGGRHRSVYCAERVAKKIAAQFPSAVVELIHREQNIHEILI